MADARAVTVYHEGEKKSETYEVSAETMNQMAREEQKKKPDASFTDAAGKSVAIDWTKWRLVKIE